MMRISEAAKRLGVTPTTLRRWEEEGRLHPERTAGGERRYHEFELDQLASPPVDVPARNRRDRTPNQRPGHHPDSSPAESFEDTPTEDDITEPSIAPEIHPWNLRVYEARADLEVRRIETQEAELDRTEQEAAAARQQKVREAAHDAVEQQARLVEEQKETQRLANLRRNGDLVAALAGAPIEYRAAVTRDLATYVTSAQFPPSAWIHAYACIEARVEETLKPWHEEQAKAKEREGRAREESRRQQQRERLIGMGLSHVDTVTRDWDAEPGKEAKAEAEEALREQVEDDWTRADVVELVDEMLEEWD